jgi:hypothetical protein
VEDIANLVPLEWQSDEEIASRAPILIVGPVSSFGEYILAFLNRHIDLIERKNDTPIMPFIDLIKTFRDRVILPHVQPDPSKEAEKFVFTHADLGPRNILVDILKDESNLITRFVLAMHIL